MAIILYTSVTTTVTDGVLICFCFRLWPVFFHRMHSLSLILSLPQYMALLRFLRHPMYDCYLSTSSAHS